MCIQHCQRKGRPPSFCSNVLNGNYHSLFAHAWDTLGTLSLITGAHKMILGRLQGSHSLVFVSHGSRTRISRWFVWYSLHPYSSNSPVERSPGAKRGLGCSSRFLLARGVGCGEQLLHFSWSSFSSCEMAVHQPPLLLRRVWWDSERAKNKLAVWLMKCI